MPIIPAVNKAARRMEALNRAADAALIAYMSASNKHGTMDEKEIALMWAKLRSELDLVLE